MNTIDTIDLRIACEQMHELFYELNKAGFSEEQSIEIISKIIKDKWGD